MNIKTIDINDISPKPPNCIKINITKRPKTEYCSSATVVNNPVTQVALVAVNRLSMSGNTSRLFDIGRDRSNVPIIIIKRKLDANIFATLNLFTT